MQRVRESAVRTAGSSNKLKQFGLAYYNNHHDLALAVCATECGDAEPPGATDPTASHRTEEQNKQEAQREGKGHRAVKDKSGE